MKKLIKIFIIVAFYIGLILLNTKVYAATANVSKDLVVLREKASTNSEVIAVLPVKTEVEIISKSGDWYNVTYKEGKNTYTGYIREDLLKVNEEKTTEKTETTNTVESNTTTGTTSNETNTTESTSNEMTTTENKEEKEELQENATVTLSNKVDLKILPLVNSTNIGSIDANSNVFITEIVGKWIRVENGTLSGWVLSSKVQAKKEDTTKTDDKTDDNKTETKTSEEKTTETKTMYVSANALNLREEAKTNAKIIDQLLLNDKVTVLEKVDNTWSKVKVSGKTGYVVTEFLSSKKTETTSRGNEKSRTSEESKKTSETKKTETKKTETKTTETKKVETKTSETKTTESKSTSGVTGEDVVAYAKQFLGYKYVYGTAGPNTFDCSGFTSYVYKHFGYKLNRVANAQQSNGTAVKKSDLQAGDIVCFNGHVGIYIGDGKFIHAENHKTGVVISKLSQSYYKNNYVTARRIIK